MKAQLLEEYTLMKSSFFKTASYFKIDLIAMQLFPLMICTKLTSSYPGLSTGNKELELHTHCISKCIFLYYQCMSMYY